MKNLLLLLLLSLFIDLTAQPVDSDGYLWPTNASKYLTSSFGEYRSRRYHMGIDIKTWGKVGYKVFATRSGYVSRISVAPTGYGKVLYLKLDTGETAVMAHLSRFSEEIEELVWSEQQRLGKYRINVYLKKGRFPVEQGQVLAYSGQTGIGAPHLHFEIRDAENRPLNPLSKNYILPDNTGPVIRKVSFTPIGTQSEVNADFKPVVLPAKRQKNGEYVIDRQLQLWGNVGIAVSCYDKSPDVPNRYGVYSLKLFVDDVLRFQYSFDRLTFQDNPMVELERDYRLFNRGYGRFQKLYKDRFNTRNSYRPNQRYAGLLKSASLEEETGINAVSNGILSGDIFEQGTLFPGVHDLRIEVADFFGNVSTVSAQILIGSAFLMQPMLVEEDGRLLLEDVLTYDLKSVKKLEAYYLNNGSWLPTSVKRGRSVAMPKEKGGEAEPEVYDDPALYYINRPKANTTIMKLIGYDQFDAASYPWYYIDNGGVQTSVKPEIEFEYDYYDDYMRVVIESNHILSGLPVLSIHGGTSDSVLVALHQMSLKKYVGRFDLEHLDGEVHLLKVHGQNVSGEPFAAVDTFMTRKIMPHRTGRLHSEDEQFRVNFWSGSLYRPFYGYIEKKPKPKPVNYQFESDIFAVFPKDVLMDKGAFVQIRYAGDEDKPGQLGVYQSAGNGKWRFVENRMDQSSGAISAKIGNFSEFVLIRDDIAPEITAIRPANGARLSSRTPRISAQVRDQLSGIASETHIDIILDGERLISAYDPERNRISYRVREPLTSGEHKLIFTAKDKCGNTRKQETSFIID